jgi:murein DD-endopeptidase MepM/ murein hydrolase activator NlpD
MVPSSGGRDSPPGGDRRMTFIVVPHGGGDLQTRAFEVSYRRLRWVAAAVAVAAALWVGTIATYWYVAAQAARVPGLVREVEMMEVRQDSVRLLAAQVAEMERLYQQLRVMLGADRAQDTTSLWLPPVGAARERSSSDTVQAHLPSAWPLSRRGFVTRAHLGRLPGEHPGIDIAVAEGTYIRSAGEGRVVEAGEHPVYGKFVRIQHRDGYETLYAHASELFVREGDGVERHEVVALSGNTGTSTAPHLHFEVRKDGEPIDPLTVVQPPS